MGITVKRELGVDVVTAAKQRIINAFSNGVKVYMSVSGGKDSIVMMDITYKLMQEGKINPALMEAVFIDEEAMYEDVIDIMKLWRRRFMTVGAKFSWYCLEVKHYNCLNSLEDTESFICWDRYKRNSWCRPMPPFAITSHPLHKPREETYQAFCAKLYKDGLNMMGVRVSESVQRRKYISTVLNNSGDSLNNNVYPIYDMADSDIWLYIKENGVEYPKVYQDLYSTGTSKKSLRISQFFSIDTCKVLSKLYEFRPELGEAVMRREPNAYIVQMYWDTEMFRRSSRARKQLEETQEKKDYKKLSLEMLRNPTNYTQNPHSLKVYEAYKKVVIKHIGQFDEKMWKRIYEALVAGDPKLRSLRAICTMVVAGRGNTE